MACVRMLGVGEEVELLVQAVDSGGRRVRVRSDVDAEALRWVLDCQSASKVDPLSAYNLDPLRRWGAEPGSAELVGVAQPSRVRLAAVSAMEVRRGS